MPALEASLLDQTRAENARLKRDLAQFRAYDKQISVKFTKPTVAPRRENVPVVSKSLNFPARKPDVLGISAPPTSRETELASRGDQLTAGTSIGHLGSRDTTLISRERPDQSGGGTLPRVKESRSRGKSDQLGNRTPAPPNTSGGRKTPLIFRSTQLIATWLEDLLARERPITPQHLLVLRLLAKLFAEIQHCRGVLTDCVANKDFEEVKKTRARISWLENRVESVLNHAATQKSEDESEEESEGEEEEEFPEAEAENLVLPSARTHVTESAMSEAESYWQSDHHRVEINPHAAAVNAVTTMSYQNLAIMRTDTFLEASEIDVELPWRPKDEREFNDTEQKALDVLAAKVGRLFERAWDVTQISIKPTAPRSGSTKAQKIRKVGKVAVVMRGIAHLTYYPPVIPDPVVKRQFQEHTEVYPPEPPSLPDVGPTRRIVNQHDLHSRTRLVLYHPKKDPKVGNTAGRSPDFGTSTAASRNAGSSLVRRVSTRLETRGTARSVAKETVGLAAPPKSGWAAMKPRSGPLRHVGLKMERVRALQLLQLRDPRPDDALQGARGLGALGIADTAVFSTLKETLNGSEASVKYEALKSLLVLGCFESDVLAEGAACLSAAQGSCNEDLLTALAASPRLQFLDINEPAAQFFCKKVEKLIWSRRCKLAYAAAVFLCAVSLNSPTVEAVLRNCLSYFPLSFRSTESLRLLVNNFHADDTELLKEVVRHAEFASAWKLRLAALKLLQVLNPEAVMSRVPEVEELLQRKMWQEPVKEVRRSVARTLHCLKLYHKTAEIVKRHLESVDEEKRSRAAVSVGTLSLRGEPLLRTLIDMAELDSSDCVRMLVIQSFGDLKLWSDRRVMKILQTRGKQQGALGDMARRVLSLMTAES